MKKIKCLPLYAKTIQDRTVEISSNVIHIQVKDIQVASALSSIDESCSIKETVQITFFMDSSKRNAANRRIYIRLFIVFQNVSMK